MLNAEKIRLMTRIAVYENGAAPEDEKTAAWFRNDYVFAGMIGSFVTGTLAWGVCAAIYCVYFFEQIFFSVYEDTLGPILKFAGMSYVSFIAFFLLVTFLIYRSRSLKYRMRRTLYREDLDALTDLYEAERMEIEQAVRAMSGGKTGE